VKFCEAVYDNMALFDDPLIDMWEDDEALDFLLEEKGFPCHDIRKQTLFKLVSEQMTKARKFSVPYNLPVAARYRSGLNAVTTFEQATLEVPSDKENKGGGGGGDKEAEKTEAPSKKVKFEIPASADEEKDDEPATTPDTSPPSNEEVPPMEEWNDEYKFSTIMALDYLLDDLGLSTINLCLDDIFGGAKPIIKANNRRMRWTISKNDDHPGNENEAAGAAPSSEDSTGEDLETPLTGAGDAGRGLQPFSPICVITVFFCLYLFTEMINLYSEDLETVAWPWNLWDRLLNLSLLPNKIWDALGSLELSVDLDFDSRIGHSDIRRIRII